MIILLRHLIAIAALSFTAAVLVPVSIARRNAVTFAVGRSAEDIAFKLMGVVMLGLGLLLFFASLRRFATEGKGTLAPWDPPRRLVVRGPYRFVRNPMISGVIFVLFGEAMLLLSTPHATWAATFFVINAIYIPLLEEPMLEARFGDDYREYCRHVGRLLPRLRPWQGSRS